ncbi:hypothetical protein F4780DRAFT_764734 [Xylariomycetidae sp. FL0641]|nr:hypothetical protein F4780DRAFT_764734 [Xylariomycetidae sp. FL0641]
MYATALLRHAAEGLAARSATRPPAAPPRLLTRFRTKKVWPPDFAKLSAKEQFRLERRYKRRVKLATARPRWDRYVRLAQLGSVTFVAVYSVLFMDWKTEHQPFQGARDAFWGAVGSFSPEKRHERRNIDPAATATASERK